MFTNLSAERDSSVAASTQLWRWAFIVAFILLQAVKWRIAAVLPLFGDEAFYWQASRHLAWGYSALPGMTAWLIRLGQAIGGTGLLGVRWPFLLLGALLPWLVVAFAQRHVHAGARAWQAGLLTLALPLAGSLGLLALPDVMLTVAAMLALLALAEAMQRDLWRNWLLLGVAVALSLMSHYRAAMLLLAGLAFCTLTPRGRGVWRRRGWYVSLALGVLGVIPALIYNWHHAWVALDFQLLQRNPWQFHADALVQPLEQALICTPLFYALMLAALWRCMRRVGEAAPWDLIASSALSFLLGYFLFGLFADDTHFRVHWPLPGYLPLLAVLPCLMGDYWQASRMRLPRRLILVLSLLMLVAGQCAVLGYAWMASTPARAATLESLKAYPNAFVGWPRIGKQTRALLAQPDLADAVLVADNFRLAAELDFELHGARRVYSLDSPTNTKHGHAPQLAQWQLDEDALRREHAGQPVLLVVAETDMRQSRRVPWLRSLCNGFAELKALARLDFDGGSKRVAFYAARLRTQPLPVPADSCIIWQHAATAQHAAVARRAAAHPG
ncbi:MAG: glycosyltransferase family 39 protein [Xanthomonadales bacterium]|nr:glycosyltransferase family 39 protein [Xanthomonadales bacterium]